MEFSYFVNLRERRCVPQKHANLSFCRKASDFVRRGLLVAVFQIEVAFERVAIDLYNRDVGRRPLHSRLPDRRRRLFSSALFSLHSTLYSLN